MVLDSVVSRNTRLIFQLFLNTQRVTNGDYLKITLPSGVSFSGGSGSTCSITNIGVGSCSVTTAIATITFTTVTQYDNIQGYVTGFINPDSVRPISSFTIQLYSTLNVLKATTSQFSITSFTESSLTITLSSSSSTIGLTGATLSVSITPETIIKASGKVIVQVPEYYLGAGTSNLMIDSNTPTCAGTGITVSSCIFSSFSRQVTLTYTLTSGTDSTSASAKVFTISAFKNPISPSALSGFQVSTYDSNSYIVGKQLTISLSGITTPASLSYTNLTLADPRQIGTYGDATVKIQLSIPAITGCYVRIVFPSDFNATTQLVSLTGVGFFSPTGSAVSVPWIAKNSAGNYIDVQACYSTAINPYGELTLTKIKNPPYVKTTGTLLIFVAIDTAFTLITSKITSGFTIPALYLNPGSINNITVATSGSNYVQEETSYSFTFTPVHDLTPSGSVQVQIMIIFPSSIVLSSSGCSILSKSATFDSTSIACSISSQTVTVSSPFTNSYTGGNSLSLVISKGQNPTSATDVGSFKIQTYTVVSSVAYQVDEGTVSNQITPIGGFINKPTTEIITSSLITSDIDVIYSFSLKLQHTIPQNGFLTIQLPADVSISSKNLIKNQCITSTSVLMSCTATSDTVILITLTSPAFTNGVSDVSLPFKFSIAGFKNPRTMKQSDVFYFYSKDANGFNIDQSTSTDYFTVTMSQFSNLKSVNVENQNKTNGGSGAYIITVGVTSQVLKGDMFQIGFPIEVILPANVRCDVGSVITNVLAVFCSKLGTVLTAQLTTINAINANDQFSFTVYDVVNPTITIPSSTFTNMQLFTSSSYGIAQYTGLVTVVTSTSGYINIRTLSQSNKNPRQIATYTIRFTTNNLIPSTAAILITTPTIITPDTTLSGCYAQITQVVNNVCIIQQQLIKIEKAFSYYGGNYFGEVSLIFKATNPPDNSNLQSIFLRVYSDNTYQYRIDKIETGLVPQLQCNYPCKLCDQNNADYCTDCFTDKSLPSILQYFATNKTQTCAYSCLDGYTSNGSTNPRTCVKCDGSCKTCIDNNQTGDYKICKTCDTFSQYMYKKTQTCWPSCVEGTYPCSNSECCDCSFPCLTCSSSTQCKTCFQNSSLPLFQSNQCVDKCYSGSVPVNFKCVQCQSPCATCEGSVSVCLSCDSLSNKQFMFGRTCVSECPNGTVLDYGERKCTGCVTGCDNCDSIDNSKCLKCSNGLALLDNECLVNCPFNYVKSSDGSTCELRGYLLDGSLIYFPFLSAASFVVAISLTSFCFTKGKSLILSNAIALLSFVEVASLIFQTYQAYSRDYLRLAIATAGVHGLLLALNSLFLIYYCCKMQFQDISFNYWRQKYSLTTSVILILSTTVSFKIIRLFYSKLFGLNIFSASIDDQAPFFKQVKVFSTLSLFFFTLPLLALDSLVLFFLQWGTQLYITMIETAGISFLSAILIIFEHCWHCPCWKSCKNCCKKKPKQMKTNDVYNAIDDQSYSALDIDTHKEGSKSERRMRESLLKNIISTVKNNKDLKLNNKFDALMAQDGDSNLFRRAFSMINLDIKTPQEMVGEDDRKTRSQPGSPTGMRAQANHDDAIAPTISAYNSHAKSKNRNPKEKIQNLRRSIDLFENEFKFDNVYADAKPVRILYNIDEKQSSSFKFNPNETCQTEEIKQLDEGSSDNWNKTRFQRQKTLDDRLLQASVEELEENGKKRLKSRKHRGKKDTQFYTQINEQDNESLLSEDEKNKRLRTEYQQVDEEDYVEESSDQNEDNKSISKKSQSKIVSEEKQREEAKQKELVEQARILFEQNQSEMEQFNNRKKELEDEYFNQRSFNINDIIGNFPRDKNGEIINKETILRDNHYRDFNDKPVNQQGYLIEEESGDIINKHTFNRMFKKEDLSIDGEIPLPLRLEQYNFNPHEILGNFDFDKKSGKPIILKNKLGQLVDKNLRFVNKAGLLIDEQGNVIDNQGRIRFFTAQLSQKDDIPKLFNYSGKRYNIRDVIGHLGKDTNSKELIIETDKQNQQIDKLGRKVNAKGYLVDKIGNIINKKGKIVFKKCLLMFSEPPKIFEYTHFNVEWINGNFEVNDENEPILAYMGEGYYQDIDGKLVNEKGYLIDEDMNIIDRKERIVFQQEILQGQDTPKGYGVEIPKVFRMEIIKNTSQMMMSSQIQQQQMNSNEIVFLEEELHHGDNQMNMNQQDDDGDDQFQNEEHIADFGKQEFMISPYRGDLIQNMSTQQQQLQRTDSQSTTKSKVLSNQLSEKQQQITPSKSKKQQSNVFIQKPLPRAGNRILESYSKSAFSPMQGHSRAMSQQRTRPGKRGPSDNGSTKNVIPQDRAKERLARLANSIQGLNQTAQLSSAAGLPYNQSKTPLGMTENFSQPGLKQVIKNGYMNEHNSNYGEDDYTAYLENDVDIKTNNYQWNDNAKSKKRIIQNESNLDRIHPDQTTSYIHQQSDDDDLQSEKVSNEHFNIEKGTTFNRKLKQREMSSSKIGNKSSRSHSGDSQLSRKTYKKSQLGSKKTDLEKIYLQRLEYHSKEGSINSSHKNLAAAKNMKKQQQSVASSSFYQQRDLSQDGSQVFGGRRNRHGSQQR